MPEPGGNPGRRVQFGPFEADLDGGELRKHGLRIRLQDQPFRVLAALIERPGEVVQREQLWKLLWSDDTNVEYDQSLNTAITKIRATLGDSADNPRYIETIPRRGYRFLAHVEPLAGGGAADSPLIGGHATKPQDSPSEDLANGPGSLLPRARRSNRAIGAALALCLAAGLLLGRWLWQPDQPRPAERRFGIALPSPVSGHQGRQVAISPDGRFIVYAEAGKDGALWLHEMAANQQRRLEQTAGARAPFWSPDSQWIGFFTAASVLRIPVLGGPAQALAAVPAWPCNGGAFRPQGESVVLSCGDPPQLYRLTIGSRQRVAEPIPNTAGLVFPVFATAGRRDLLLASKLASQQEPQLVALDFPGGELRTLGAGAYPAYSPTGHLLYQASLAGGEIHAREFSVADRSISGKPFVLDRAASMPSVDNNGDMVFTTGQTPILQQLAWYDRRGGRLAGVGREHEEIGEPALAPDGRSVLFSGTERSNPNVWILDLESELLTQLSFHPGDDSRPMWAPKGDDVAFNSPRNGNSDLFVKKRDGSGEAVAVAATARNEYLCDWSRDGRYLLYDFHHPDNDYDLWYLERRGETEYEAVAFLETPDREMEGRFSPGNRFVAYCSNETGRDEVYVRPFPTGAKRWRISTLGGTQPRWNAAGTELFYVEDDTLIAVPVQTTPAFTHGAPARLFRHKGLVSPYAFARYEPSPDSRRFLMIDVIGETSPPSIEILQGWFARRGRQGN